MKLHRPYMWLAAAATLTTATGAARAQALSPGGSYVLETQASPACRAAVLHIVRENDALTGVVFFKDGSGMSSVLGHMDGRSFTWTMTPVRGDGPKGEVTGQVTAEGALSARLQGTNCTLNTTLPIYHEAPSGNG